MTSSEQCACAACTCACVYTLKHVQNTLGDAGRFTLSRNSEKKGIGNVKACRAEQARPGQANVLHSRHECNRTATEYHTTLVFKPGRKAIHISTSSQLPPDGRQRKKKHAKHTYIQNRAGVQKTAKAAPARILNDFVFRRHLNAWLFCFSFLVVDGRTANGNVMMMKSPNNTFHFFFFSFHESKSASRKVFSSSFLFHLVVVAVCALCKRQSSLY